MKVKGKVAIVTGGGGGIGGALVGELTTHGARVLVADLDAVRAQAVADKINSARPGAAAAVGADVSDTTAVREPDRVGGAGLRPGRYVLRQRRGARDTRARGQRRGLGSVRST